MHKADDIRFRLWLARTSALTPLVWLVVALVLGVLCPRLDRSLNISTGISEDAARDMLTATGSGMIAFTGFVFSLSLLIVQFGSQALSPRVVPELRRDRFAGHALGAFIATFVFCLGATLDVGDASNGATLITISVAFLLLITSVLFFLGLIQRVTTGLQIPVVLARLGRMGCGAISELYPEPYDGPRAPLEPFPGDATVLDYHHHPATLATIDLAAVHTLVERFDVSVAFVPAIGERVGRGDPLIRIAGARAADAALHHGLRRALVFAPARTIEQDPAYAFRLVVDIAIKALSPAINDPTTATQALEEIEDMLQTVGDRAVTHGEPRVRIRTPTWEDLVDLALTEIIQFGAHSVQVTRRLRALFDAVEAAVPAERLGPLRAQRDRLDAAVRDAFPDPALRAITQTPDRLGLGLASTDR